MIIEYYGEQNGVLKLVEECTELNEVLIKYLTKKEKYKPSKAKIIEEMGDVLIRMKLLAEFWDIKNEVNERRDNKYKAIKDEVTSLVERKIPFSELLTP